MHGRRQGIVSVRVPAIRLTTNDVIGPELGLDALRFGDAGYKWERFKCASGCDALAGTFEQVREWQAWEVQAHTYWN
jgi:hypothetical protein